MDVIPEIFKVRRKLSGSYAGLKWILYFMCYKTPPACTMAAAKVFSSIF
ncbi:MAG TPA: hypothetical protein VIN73_13015 [Vicingaceae bacterium]